MNESDVECSRSDLQLEAEIEACKRNRRYLFERHFVIQDEGGNLRLMQPLRLAQLKLMAVLRMCRETNLPAWIIVGKSRKQGISSYVGADALTEAMQRGIEVMVIAHESKASAYLLGIYHRYYEYLDFSMAKGLIAIPKPPLHKGQTNKYEIRFENLAGHIEIETANNVTAGRTRTPHYIHGSECAFWEKGALTAVSLFQSMRRLPGTTFIAESTFNGEDSLFYPLWNDAYRHAKVTFTKAGTGMKAHLEVINAAKWNGWIPLFISVIEDESARQDFLDPERRRDFKENLDAYETMLVERHDVTLEFLNWRRTQIRQTCQGDLSIFKQEYPVTPEEAIQISKRARFDAAKLDTQPLEDGERGELRSSDSWDRRITWRADPTGLLIRYRKPVPNHRYVIGADASEGKLDAFGKEQDASVVSVHDCDLRLEQVAVLFGSVSEENLVEPVKLLGEYYNHAYEVVESNSCAKHLCIQLGKIYPQELLYHRDDWDEQKRRQAREIGHRTHTGNKSHLISSLADAINDEEIIFHCKETVRELRAYEWQVGGGTAAKAGYHDDHVIAPALAVLGAKNYPATRPKPTADRPVFQQLTKPKYKMRQTASAVTGY